MANKTVAVQSASVPEPTPFGPLPTARQLTWHELEFYGFLHFTVNTFTDKEWGYGDETPDVFNPTAFDADQMVSVARDAGMRGLILTCKHHDGFCLWPSRYTEHSVRTSAWRQGKGNAVKDIAESCARHGIKFGVYLSPWDRNHAGYGSQAYIAYYRNQLRELLSEFGELFEVWFDGANGGDGFYGGARETRTIDKHVYYEWEKTWELVRELQPNACMFSDAGPDIRWVGNESGFAGDPCWSTFSRDECCPGEANVDILNHGALNGRFWVPAECDVSIRPGWFYHAAEDDKVRTPQNLMTLYFQSVGRGASLLLNLPPDRRGLIHENDVRSLQEFRRQRDAIFATDLARGATATTSQTRGNDLRFAPANVCDGRRESYWSTDDTVTRPELVLALPAPVTFNVVSLREAIALGQRVDAFALDAWLNGAWQEIASAAAIGNRRLLRCAAPVTTDKVRLRITRAAACPAIAELGLFLNPF